MTTNTDDTAFPRPTAYEHPDRFAYFGEIQTSGGLSKRELACILCRVPATGDADLDAIIARAERRDVAVKAMQGVLAAPDYDRTFVEYIDLGVDYADALIDELAKAPEGGTP